VRTLVIGRFQPFHLGHLHIVLEADDQADEVIVAIAAAADYGTFENPFTAQERGEMIALALDAVGIGPYRIVEVPDIHDPPRWARYVMSVVPAFDLVVAHNADTLDLFDAEGVPTRRATPYRMDEISGTRVRRLMLEGGEWEGLVPATVAEYLHRIDGASRVRRIGGKD
jgi:nicotinamide-nucleotide adenylyltransferase